MIVHAQVEVTVVVATVARARLDYEQTIRNATQDTLNLAFKIAEKIIGKKVEMDQHVIMDIVKQALQTVRQSKQITIRVNVEDARVMREHQDVMMETLGHEPTALGVARLYAGLADVFVLDRADAALAGDIADLGLRPVVCETVMVDPVRRQEVGRQVLEGVLA